MSVEKVFDQTADTGAYVRTFGTLQTVHITITIVIGGVVVAAVDDPPPSTAYDCVRVSTGQTSSFGADDVLLRRTVLTENVTLPFSGVLRLETAKRAKLFISIIFSRHDSRQTA